jgi:ATP-dependent DNA helicase RecG
MLGELEIRSAIRSGESLTREFKSDRQRLSDSVIYEEVVALANADGGILLIGVEDDGVVTGAQPRHGTATDPLKLQSAIFNNTVPNINTRVSTVPFAKNTVIAVEVDPYPEPCATASGKSLRRTIGGDGLPQSTPFYPRDQRSRRTDMGLLDFSAQTMEGIAFDDLDPLEFERLRQTITRLRGDQSLLHLSPVDLAKALRLVETRNDRIVPNVAGLLLLGRESVLQSALPTHQFRFQVLDAQGAVKANDLFRGPLIRLLDELKNRFDARNEEREVTVGLFRVPVPDYSPEGFREALNNAVLHRDYTRMDSVYAQWHPDHLLITNPGGFPDGISVNNLLVHEPKPRNPRLAEAFTRIGLVEQTGRGVDKIYVGQLRYGRPIPDYSRSDASGVRVVLRGGSPSLQFAAFVYEQDKAGRALTLDELIILNALFHERRLDSQAAGNLIQKGSVEGHAVLERLQERGLVEGRGSRPRAYHLSGALYKRLGDLSGYVRTRGFDQIQHEQMIGNALDQTRQITRYQVAELCQITKPQAYHLLRKLSVSGKLEQHGKGRGAYYTRKRTGKRTGDI